MKRDLPSTYPVRAGQQFRRDSGVGPYVSRVLGRHRDAGYWETVVDVLR